MSVKDILLMGREYPQSVDMEDDLTQSNLMLYYAENPQKFEQLSRWRQETLNLWVLQKAKEELCGLLKDYLMFCC